MNQDRKMVKIYFLNIKMFEIYPVKFYYIFCHCKIKIFFFIQAYPNLGPNLSEGDADFLTF